MSASAAMQEYLAEAYRIAYYQDGNPYISTSALAEVMGVSAPAVTRMVQRLKDAGYLEHQPYKGILLTPKGEQEALRSIRRHRLVEVFLVNVMQFGWDEVHDAADTLGESASDDVVARMEQMAHFPRRCPHGEPIPGPDGRMPRVRDYPLSEQATGATYAISRVNTHDAPKLQYLGQMGLKPGAVFDLVSRAPFNGPLELRINDQAILIGHELAGVLRVCSPAEFELKAV
ncbi:MAG: metal-dependent transcriptional regulator [Pleurocapsa minor GSE-CHR-MK-17-07R]|jgi:DtxR family Mn-dependent transcriptional regulator|nr:metal-dependent transcriptional regulator [Pleurocapsa minor GSE-CHR-MK 17-07R]